METDVKNPLNLDDEILKKIETQAVSYTTLMAYYRCAIMEVETKFNVLNEELSIQYDRNPIETVKSRLKKPRSIGEKLERLGIEVSVENTLPTNPLVPEVPAVDSPSGVVDNPVETQEEEKAEDEEYAQRDFHRVSQRNGNRLKCAGKLPSS